MRPPPDALLHLRLSATTAQADRVVGWLQELDGVTRLACLDGGRPGEVVISADVERRSADALVERIGASGIGVDDYVLVRSEVVAPQAATTREEAGRSVRAFSWVEILGEARANSHPFGRYLTLIAAAGVIAAMGVIETSPILVIGAMAVSPDLLPICATCVGIVLRHRALAARAFATLVIGLLLIAAISMLFGAAVIWLGFLDPGYKFGGGDLDGLAQVGYSTVIVALAAGVAGMVSFETRAGAVVGVAISVTTIPASAFAGVAYGAGEPRQAAGALLVLATNVTLLILSGTATLIVQRRLTARARSSGPSGAPAP